MNAENRTYTHRNLIPNFYISAKPNFLRTIQLYLLEVGRNEVSTFKEITWRICVTSFP